MPAPASPTAPLAWRAAYHLAATTAAAAALPLVLLGGLVRRRWWTGLGERLGAAPRLAGAPLWLHAASVGELQVVEPLARELRSAHPELPLALSVTTPAGRLAAGRLTELLAAPAFQLPADVAPLPGRALDRLRPRALVLVETELWPNLLAACRQRGLPVALVNGRIEKRSCARYRRALPLVRPLLSGLSLLAMRSRADAERALSLGARPETVRWTGNVKFDAAARQAAELSPLAWAETAGLDRGRWLVLGSTAAGEEEELLPLHARLAARLPELRTLIAPRRPERWDEIARLVERLGLPLLRRSSLGAGPVPGSAPVPPGGVLLLDTVGELARVYRHGEIAFVGGSLVARGGQNPLEAAAAGCPVVFGPHAFHFRDAERVLLDSGGGRRVQGPADLERTLAELLFDDEQRTRMGRAAREAVLANAGAARRTLDLLEPLLLSGGSS